MVASLASLGKTFRVVFDCAHRDEFEKSLTHYFQSQNQSWFGAIFSSTKEETDSSSTLLPTSISKTEVIYHECLEQLLPHLKLFQEYLLLSCNGNTVRLDPEKLRQAKTAICNFYESTHSLIVLLRRAQAKPETIKSPLRENLKCFSTHFNLKMAAGNLDKWIGKYARIIALEGISNKELPYVLLKWFSENFTCEQDASDNPEKMQELSDLLRRFKRAEENFNVAYLHKGLVAIVAHLKAFHHFHSVLPEPSLVALEDAFHRVSITNLQRDLENEVSKKGMLKPRGIFSENDASHLKWRDSLKPGDKLRLGDRIIVLGAQLGMKSFGGDHYLVFNIEGDEDNLVRIGPNKAILGLIGRYSDPKAEVPLYQVRYVERNGLFAIVEKLYPPRCLWGSGNPACPDLGLIPFIAFFKRCIQSGKMMAGFRLSDLMLNKEGQLRSLIQKAEVPLNVKSLDDIFYQMAAENEERYIYLLKATGLPTVSENKFYLTVMRNALQGEHPNFYSSAALDDIVEPDVIDHSKKLYKEVIQLREELKSLLQQKYVLDDPGRVLEILNETILLAYEKSQAFGRFFPSLKLKIEQMICANVGLKMLERFSESVSKAAF